MFGLRTISKITPIVGPLEDDYELFDVLDAIKPFVLNYRWSVSETDGFLHEDTPSHIVSLWRASQAGWGWGVGRQVSGGPPAASPVVWVSGEELLEMARYAGCTNWGAFLAFEPEDADFEYASPPGSGGAIQHPKAQIEIQAVDGGYFELFSRDREVESLLKRHFEVEIIDSDDL